MGSQSPTLLIDGDIVLHQTLAAQEVDIDWGDGVSTIYTDHEECKTQVKSTIEGFKKKLGAKKVMVALTGSNNFRKDIYPDYKGNRTGRKPVGWVPIKDWMMDYYDAKIIDGIEADDILGIWATGGKLGRTIIVSDDKDLASVPGELYVPRTKELVKVSRTEADLFFFHQCLVGDRTDNYKGCPNIGEVKATKIIKGAGTDHTDLWSSVVACFERAGLGEEDALLQARLARILRREDFDAKNKKPILWTGPNVTRVGDAGDAEEGRAPRRPSRGVRKGSTKGKAKAVKFKSRFVRG